MNAPAHVSIHADAQLLARTTATHLIERLADVQAERGEATVVLTGGTVGGATLRAVAASAGRQAVDWSRVNFWWGDERFVSANDPERNAVQAADDLLRHIPADAARVHAVGASDEYPDVDAAAGAYAADLASAAAAEAGGAGTRTAGTGGLELPRFDVLLLGVGPDAHIASLFPDLAGVRASGTTTVGVRDAPKPPPLRVSLTLDAINTAREVWLVVSGPDKAGAVGLALAGASPVQVPAAGAQGRNATLWLIDQEAAAEVPEALIAAGTPGTE